MYRKRQKKVGSRKKDSFIKIYGGFKGFENCAFIRERIREENGEKMEVP